MRKLTFTDYVRYREGLTDDKFGMDQEGDDIEKLNHFMLLAVADPDIRGSLFPILSQIAGQDDTGEMQDLLRRIDINSLGHKAKKMLKNKKHPEDNDDGPANGDEQRLDNVKPAVADSGNSELNNQGEGE